MKFVWYGKFDSIFEIRIQKLTFAKFHSNLIRNTKIEKSRTWTGFSTNNVNDVIIR